MSSLFALLPRSRKPLLLSSYVQELHLAKVPRGLSRRSAAGMLRLAYSTASV